MSAEVVLVYRVLPSGPEVDLARLREAIVARLQPKYRVDRFEEQPIGFGITALRVYVRHPESDEYSSDEVEDLLRQVEGVGGVELEYFSRLGF